MFLGTQLVIKESKINDSIIKVLLTHPYLTTSQPIHNISLQDTFITGQPQSEYDSAVLQFLKDEQYDYKDNYIEYWFQKHNSNMKVGLTPHCDYNFIYREKMKLEGNDWPHKVDPKHIVSPITIAVYLEISDDMEGGELCISSRTWYEELEPAAIDTDYIKQFPYATINPQQGQVLYFKGSDHFHWINTVTKGTRKSMLINFWPKELLSI